MTTPIPAADLTTHIQAWARALGFQAIGVSHTDLGTTEAGLVAWLANGYQGEMDYLARHGNKRTRPAELVPGTLSVISARLNYWAEPLADSAAVLDDSSAAYVSRYALGRDYHKVLRQKLQALAEQIETAVAQADPNAAPFAYRVFTDSAPVMEVALAQQAGLGWRGKHTLLLSRDAGSLYFLGEIYTNLPLTGSALSTLDDETHTDHNALDQQTSEHDLDEKINSGPLFKSTLSSNNLLNSQTSDTEYCGSCTRCITVCPTQAIIAPYVLDARRCISYLTIELAGSIPVEFRAAMGNRIYGCDDCQLFCPWNKYAQLTTEADFQPRNGLASATLIELFSWTAAEFEQRLAGSAIRRIGHERWLRNIAVALGNALRDATPATALPLVAALHARAAHASTIVQEHVSWALVQNPGYTLSLT